jgi:hypothetical protein
MFPNFYSDLYIDMSFSQKGGGAVKEIYSGMGDSLCKWCQGIKGFISEHFVSLKNVKSAWWCLFAIFIVIYVGYIVARTVSTYLEESVKQTFDQQKVYHVSDPLHPRNQLLVAQHPRPTSPYPVSSSPQPVYENFTSRSVDKKRKIGQKAAKRQAKKYRREKKRAKYAPKIQKMIKGFRELEKKTKGLLTKEGFVGYNINQYSPPENLV